MIWGQKGRKVRVGKGILGAERSKMQGKKGVGGTVKRKRGNFRAERGEKGILGRKRKKKGGF